MFKSIILIFIILFSSSVALAQRSSPPSKAELAEITERGRQLAEYDVAAWHATDAVLAMKPPEGSVAGYIAKKTGSVWAVMFGRFNESHDKFLIVYEANQGTSPQDFNVKKYDPPKEDMGFYLFAFKSIETVKTDFQGEKRPYNSEKRPYNIGVLPAKLGQVYVYVVPGQTQEGVYPLGGDVRYLVSQDGAKIVEKRQLHKTIIEFATQPDGQKVEAGFHTAVLDDIPEDTDVFHVIRRKPAVPEYVATKQYVYRIEPDGTINYVMTAEAFKKIKNK